MRSTANNRPWALQPNTVCSTFPENPVTNKLTGENKWEINLKCKLKEVTKGDACVIAILPNYTALDIHKENLFFTITYEDDSSEYDMLPIDIYNGQVIVLKIVHTPKKGLGIFINNVKMLEFDLTSKNIKSSKGTCVVLGSNTFSPNSNSKPSDLDLYDFKVYVNDVLESDHDFTNIIFNKSYDKTKNLNFLHTYNEG